MTGQSISVVMATYNGERYIREQIDSILNQSYPIYELIIQDDCSTDSTADIVKDYAARYSCIHFFQNESNLGFKNNFKAAVMRAKGDFVALSDQDDVWYPQKLEKQLKAIGNCDLCYSQYHCGFDKESLHVVRSNCYAECHMFNFVVGHSFLMRRQFSQDNKSWLDFMWSHDQGLCILAHLSNGVTCVNEPLNWHRTHGSQVSHPLFQTSADEQHGWADALKPYIKGYKRYRRLQSKKTFRMFYATIQERSKGKNPLVCNISQLLLSDSMFSLAKLCIICMKHRKTIYPEGTHGLIGIIRGFCFPFIYSYHCDYYDREC